MLNDSVKMKKTWPLTPKILTKVTQLEINH